MSKSRQVFTPIQIEQQKLQRGELNLPQPVERQPRAESQPLDLVPSKPARLQRDLLQAKSQEAEACSVESTRVGPTTEAPRKSSIFDEPARPLPPSARAIFEEPRSKPSSSLFG